MNKVLNTVDILLPTENISHELWSVIACDQFSSQQSYWDGVMRMVGDNPSTLNMIIPEAYLDNIDEDSAITKIADVMERYISMGIFREIKDSFIYVERELSDGNIRRGLVGAVDLEEYDFTEGANASIVASEGTVLDRLPPRIRIREAASLELPHIITFIADKNNTVFKPLIEKRKTLPLLYNFKLMEDGGHLRGYQVNSENASEIITALSNLALINKSSEQSVCASVTSQPNPNKPGGSCKHGDSRLPATGIMVMGDGNHSLAAAKTYWEKIKLSLSCNDSLNHPARYALVEVNNIYDPSIKFDAIHRVIFDVDVDNLINTLSAHIESGDKGDGRDNYVLQILSSAGRKSIKMSTGSAYDIISIVQSFLDDYKSNDGGRIDYIHDEKVVENLTKEFNCVGILLPIVNKKDFFDSVTTKGIFPRKSFSVGHAADKRYYMECRKIKHFNEKTD